MSTEGRESFFEAKRNLSPLIKLGTSFLYGGEESSIALYFSNSNLEVWLNVFTIPSISASSVIIKPLVATFRGTLPP